MNAIVTPIVMLLSLPFIILTLGLMIFVVNALMLMLTSWISEQIGLDFHVDGFWTAVWGSIVISIVSWLIGRVLVRLTGPRMPPPRTTLPAPRRARQLPGRPRVPRQHLPLADGPRRARVARSPRPGSTTGSRSCSAGTGGWHVGKPMDRRAAATLTAAGYDAVAATAAQQFAAPGYDELDLVLAMDTENLADLRRRWPWGRPTPATAASGASATSTRLGRATRRTATCPTPTTAATTASSSVLAIVERTADVSRSLVRPARAPWPNR